MSTPDLPPVIKLQEVTKIFSTDEVDTHALATVRVGRTSVTVRVEVERSRFGL